MCETKTKNKDTLGEKSYAEQSEAGNFETLKKQHIKEIICRAKRGKKN